MTTSRDVSDLKRTQQALESRILALTRPLSEDAPVAFEDLFNLDEIQELQDLFADATGVASMIMAPRRDPRSRSPAISAGFAKMLSGKPNSGCATVSAPMPPLAVTMSRGPLSSRV